MSEKKVYFLLSGIALLGYIYIVVALSGVVNDQVSLCMFHNVTGIPCPSCGTTRGMMQLIHGQFTEALRMNALCYVQAFFLLILPVLLVIDLIGNKRTLLYAYNRAIQIINRPWIAFILGVLLLVNWIYLIYAGR